ncbi:MAG: DNA polymerase III subunit delta [Tannerella sp.]|jgi:DNA polymerase-3 subunit delta|nr:DNA polymerase III subunit delta [Tannerella sp.]
MAKEAYTYETICADIKAGKYVPIYFLMGEEPYFIDKITELLIDNVLPDDSRTFDQHILYGADTRAVDIIHAAKQFPSMMSERRLIVVREAQLVKGLELLENYVKQPLASTVLVINYKYSKYDAGVKSGEKKKAFMAAIRKNGILFDSEKIRDYRMPAFIHNTLKARTITADEKSVRMLVEHLGNDLSLLSKELDKLSILLSAKSINHITPEIVEANVGISKEYNNFELVNAIAKKDILKANRIIRHFGRNPKVYSIQKTLPLLFNYFVNLLICHYENDKSESAIMKTLNFHHYMQTTDYKEGLRHFSGKKVFNIIHEIRIASARANGYGATSHTTSDDIMKELLYKILH